MTPSSLRGVPAPPVPAWPARAEGGRRVVVSGALDPAGLARLDALCWDALCWDALGRRPGRLVVDLAGMTDAPSAVFWYLARLGAAARCRGVPFELVGLAEAVVNATEGPPPVDVGAQRGSSGTAAIRPAGS
jgi:hypothetical protein